MDPNGQMQPCKKYGVEAIGIYNVHMHLSIHPCIHPTIHPSNDLHTPIMYLYLYIHTDEAYLITPRLRKFLIVAPNTLKRESKQVGNDLFIGTGWF